MLLKTFMEVFPHTTVWSSPSKMGTYLMGTPQRLVIDRNAFENYFNRLEVKRDLSMYTRKSLDGPAVLSLLLFDEDSARKYASNAPILTDDLPLIEFPLFKNSPSTRIMHTDLISNFVGGGEQM